MLPVAPPTQQANPQVNNLCPVLELHTSPPPTAPEVMLTFGAPQGTDVRPIRRDDITGTGQPLSRQAVANYIAKYTTKILAAPASTTAKPSASRHCASRWENATATRPERRALSGLGPSSVKGTRRSFLTAPQKRSSGPALERRRPNASPAGLTARPGHRLAPSARGEPTQLDTGT